MKHKILLLGNNLGLRSQIFSALDGKDMMTGVNFVKKTIGNDTVQIWEKVVRKDGPNQLGLAEFNQVNAVLLCVEDQTELKKWADNVASCSAKLANVQFFVVSTNQELVQQLIQKTAVKSASTTLALAKVDKEACEALLQIVHMNISKTNAPADKPSLGITTEEKPQKQDGNLRSVSVSARALVEMSEIRVRDMAARQQQPSGKVAAKQSPSVKPS